jgi:alpha-tubulin suppressor-like RCC1 family protein
MPSGGVQCWGNNQSGQLGDGSGIDKYIQYVPAVSDVFTGAQAIALGTKHTCALTSSGGVRCWGRNFEGQLGDGTLYYSDKPPPTDVIADVQAIAAGSLHTCVLTTAGGVRCWGDNTKGQLGDGTTTSRGSPPTSDAISGVRAIHANNAHTCVILVDGGLRCWGDGVLTPPTQDIIGGVAAVTSSSEHSCALMETGGVRCWGQNGSGQLGDGTTTATTAPPATDVLTGVRAVVAGEYFTCALTVAGGLRCWGRGASGMSGALGMEYDYADHYVPPDTDVLDGIQGLSLGRRNGCVLTNAGAIRCWGDFYSGLRGDGYNRDWSTAERITGEVLTGAQVVVMGEGHTCALTISGGVRCWGDGSEGQLGDGRANYRAAPVWVTGTCRQ